jgi:hypothetical protein
LRSPRVRELHEIPQTGWYIRGRQRVIRYEIRLAGLVPAHATFQTVSELARLELATRQSKKSKEKWCWTLHRGDRWGADEDDLDHVQASARGVQNDRLLWSIRFGTLY